MHSVDALNLVLDRWHFVTPSADLQVLQEPQAMIDDAAQVLGTSVNAIGSRKALALVGERDLAKKVVQQNQFR